MEDYGLVSSDPPWKWVVNKSCFVSWSDQEEGPSCLGQLSPVNSTSKFTVNIGRRSDELLIALHLPVSIRATRQPREFLMIIPCDFDASAVDATFAPVQADERIKSADLGDCNLFRIPIRLAVPCDVIMPRDKRRKPVKGTPRELMARLKSLSKTSSFDVYFRFDTYAQLELRKIFESLALKQYKNATILLDSMYDGCGGGINLWHHQGLDIELDSTRHHSHPESPQGGLPLPPPYTRDNVSSLDSNQSRPHEPPADVQIPCSDAANDSFSRKTNSDDEGVPETPFWARMQRILDYRSPSANYCRRNRFKRAASVDSLPDARHGKHIRACHSPLLESSTRKPSTPVKHGELAAAANHGVNSPTNPSIDKLESSWHPYASTPASLPVDWDAEKTVVVHHDACPTFDKAEEIARWLYSAWSVLPDAHNILRSELLALGATQGAKSFAEVRIDCSTGLAFAAARMTKQTSVEPLIQAPDFVKQVREVVQWVNGARHDADIALFHDLAALAGAAMDAADCVHQDREDKADRFSMLTARCIAAACVL